jgi:hypothetical protein
MVRARFGSLALLVLYAACGTSRQFGSDAVGGEGDGAAGASASGDGGTSPEAGTSGDGGTSGETSSEAGMPNNGGDTGAAGETGSDECAETAYDLSGCPCGTLAGERTCYLVKPGPSSPCSSGTQTCVKRGPSTVWGECAGAGEPSTEQCFDAIDNDCDGTVDSDCVGYAYDSLPGYTGDWSAQDVTVVGTTQSFASAIKDHGPGKHDAAQATPASQAVWTEHDPAVNGRASLTFDGSKTFYLIPDPVLNGAASVTAYFVLYLDGGAYTPVAVPFGTQGASTGGRFFLNFGQSGLVGYPEIDLAAGPSGSWTQYYGAGPFNDSGHLGGVVLTARVRSGSMNLKDTGKWGVEQSKVWVDPKKILSADNAGIGGSTSGSFRGKILRIIVCQAADDSAYHATDTVDATEAALAAEYGIKLR